MSFAKFGARALAVFLCFAAHGMAAAQVDRAPPLDKALVIGPANAPAVIEFTDPDCPYCRALQRFWEAKAAQGRPVRRFIFFVTSIHPRAAEKAEHILCSADREAAFKAVYAGAEPREWRKCASGAAMLRDDAKIVRDARISGTPTIIAGGKLILGFDQDALEAFLKKSKASSAVLNEIGLQEGPLEAGFR